MSCTRQRGLTIMAASSWGQKTVMANSKDSHLPRWMMLLMGIVVLAVFVVVCVWRNFDYLQKVGVAASALLGLELMVAALSLFVAFAAMFCVTYRREENVSTFEFRNVTKMGYLVMLASFALVVASLIHIRLEHRDAAEVPKDLSIALEYLKRIDERTKDLDGLAAELEEMQNQLGPSISDTR